MRSLVAALSLLVVSGIALADEPAVGPSAVSATIDRGLAFLVKDAQAWRDEHHCVSCHHAGLVLWSLHEAKGRGHAVDEPALAELTKWVATEAGDGKTSLPRPESAPRALNEKAISLALGLGADPAPDAVALAGVQRLLTTVKADQIENGSWSSWPETRQPIFGNSDERTTLVAMLSLLSAATAGDETAKTARDKGVEWLTATRPEDDPQNIALRLVLWQRLGRPSEESLPLVQRIKERQREDGGWSQTTDMASDAWATGQALYALASAGLKPDDSAIARGHAFLVKSQRDDGSWAMTSRPVKPGGEGSGNLIPITGAGSAWAVMGLARSH
jgi:hypothetical protein